MKKVFSIIFIHVLTFGVFGVTTVFGGGAVKIGIDSAGEQVLRVGSTSVAHDVDNSSSFALELDAPLSETMDFGGGLEFQVPRQLTGIPGEFSFMPIYAYARFHPALSDITPYLVAQLGFNIFIADDNYTGTLGETQSGLHIGLGCGFISDKVFLFELLYTVDTGTVLYPSPFSDVEIEYGKLTMSVGFIF